LLKKSVLLTDTASAVLRGLLKEPVLLTDTASAILRWGAERVRLA